MKTKAFDCVEMKRQGSRRVYEHIKTMTRAQELAYWRRRTAQLDQRIKAAKRKTRRVVHAAH
ncbi:MAG: hypothetical protein PHU85_02905 [Phycisphaerae bacterium]|nr:hypothetical protein [Phycisphaerae bacterium]